MLDGWERAAAGWGRRAEAIRDFGMPVSVWMIEHLELQPGQRLLDLAAGPGDTGFLAAELVAPGGRLVSSDAAEAMLEVARERARKLGVQNVEFTRLELEWLDLPTASVDAALCRWGFMLSSDPAAALRETRRVLRPGGRLTLAVWDEPAFNPWATIPGKALITLGHSSPPEPGAPGMFALAPAERLREFLEEAGFVEVLVDAVALKRDEKSIDAYIEETRDLSRIFGEAFEQISDPERERLRGEIASLAAPFLADDGSVHFPARSLVALANA